MTCPKTILICHSELHVVRAIEYRFRTADYVVRSAMSVDAVHQELGRQPIDALVTDVRLGESCGLELIGEIRTNPDYRSTPVILLSDKGFEIARDPTCESLGVITIVPKPFSPRELLSIVDDILLFDNVPAQDAFLRPNAHRLTPVAQ